MLMEQAVLQSRSLNNELQQGKKNWAVIVAGPTCSGKSFLALQLAQSLNGSIINADAMQCYADLRIITARPSFEDEKRVPHYLYGVLPWYETGNVGWWRQQALNQLQKIWENHKLPVLCGGTGMYFHSLIHGIAMIPEPDPSIRKQARQLVNDGKLADLYNELAKEDPESVEELKFNDSQRIARAWEVWKSSGKGLRYWQKHAHLPGADCNFIVIRLAPERSVLRQAVANRFGLMIDEGALEEVKLYAEKKPSLSCPLSRAHGVPEFMAYLNNRISINEAVEQAVKNTQRYIKRQETWFSHRILAPVQQTCIFNSRMDKNTQYLQRIIKKSELFINSFIDE